MTKFTTNYGNDIKAENMAQAVEKLVQSYVELTADRLKCPVKLKENTAFTSPRMSGTGVRVVIVPDLPDFVARHLRELPEVEQSFLVSESAPGCEAWELKNLQRDSLPYLYHGATWKEVAVAHCYFIAGCGAVRDGRDPAALFVNGFQINSPGHAYGQIVARNPIGVMVNHGSVHAVGKRIAA